MKTLVYDDSGVGIDIERVVGVNTKTEIPKLILDTGASFPFNMPIKGIFHIFDWDCSGIEDESSLGEQSLSDEELEDRA